MNNIFRRKSIRKYSDKALTKEEINLLLRAGMQAPSAVNEQAWEFIVVENKENLSTLSNMSAYAKFLEKAGAAIIVLGDMDRVKAHDFWIQDASAATENILLEATELNLGACWLGVYTSKHREDYIRENFNVPLNVVPFAVISVGNLVDDANLKVTDRFDEAKVHFEKM